MEVASPPDMEKRQPSQGRAPLIISNNSSFFEIKEEQQQSILLSENDSVNGEAENLNRINANTPNRKFNGSKHFSLEQFNKINIPPNQQEAQKFSNQINNPISSILIQADQNANTHFSQSNDINSDFAFSNLHILFAKEEIRSIPFQVSPVTSISSPFTENDLVQLLNSGGKRTEGENNELKFNISDNSVAYRQCIDFEFNYNFEFSETSSFNTDLVKNSIEETQNIEIYDDRTMNQPGQIIFDSSYELFEKLENSDAENTEKIINNIQKTNQNPPIPQTKKPIKNDNQIKLSEKQIQLESNQSNNFNSDKKTKISVLISNPVCFSSKEKKLNASVNSDGLITHSPISRSSSMEFYQNSPSFNIHKNTNCNTKRLPKQFGISPMASITSLIVDDDQIKEKHEKKSIKFDDDSNISNLDYSEIFSKDDSRSSSLNPIDDIKNTSDILSSPNSVDSASKSRKNNELQICSLSKIDFKVKESSPKFNESEMETLISLEISDDSLFKSSNESHKNNDHLTTPKKKRLPLFSASTPSTMANIRYSPQDNNPKDSSFITTESESIIYDEFHESSMTTITSIPTDQKSTKTTSKRKLKKQLPHFTTSEPSTMANIRYSPQKELMNDFQKQSSLFINNEPQTYQASETDDIIDIEESEITSIISVEYQPKSIQKEKKIKDHKPKFSTSQLSTMANKRFSSQSTNSEFSSSLAEIDKEAFKESEMEAVASSQYTSDQKQLEQSDVYLNEKVVKSDQKEQKQIPSFSTSELSSMANIQYSSQKTKLQQSLIESTEITNNEQDLDSEDIKQEKLEDEININESELITITSINFVPIQSRKHKNSLILSDQIVIENNSNESNRKSSKVIQTVQKSSREIPKFSTSDPLTMSNAQYSNLKKKLQRSKASSFDFNDNEKEEFNISSDQEDEMANFNNINQSDLTTITSINYIPYHDQKQKDSLVLSEQVIIENNNNQANINQSPKKTTKQSISKETPVFSTSEPSIMSNIQYSSSKEKLRQSQLSSIECNNINEKDFNSNSDQKHEDDEEETNNINIKESDLIAITSINYVPYTDQKQNKSLTLSEQIIIENENDEIKQSQNETTNSIQTKRNNSKEVPLFTTSEPSTMSNIQFSSSKEKLRQSQLSSIECNNINEKDFNSNSDQKHEDDEEETNNINIKESDLIAITSINYVPCADQNQNKSLTLSEQIIIENENDEIKQSQNKTTNSIQTKRNNSKEVPLFTTSEPSTMSNIQYSSLKRKLQQSKIKSTEIFDNDDNKTSSFSKHLPEIIDQEIEEEIDEKININESKLITITSINYVPYQHEKQPNESSLMLSDQIIIENSNNESETIHSSIEEIEAKVIKITKQKQMNDKKIPTFSTSEPSTMTNIQNSSLKRKLHQSKVSSMEFNNTNDDKPISPNTIRSAEIIHQEIEEEEEIVNEINISESDPTTIASINFVPYENEKLKETPLILSNKVAIENEDANNENVTNAQIINTPKSHMKSTQITKTKNVPSFSTSNFSTIANLQFSPNDYSSNNASLQPKSQLNVDENKEPKQELNQIEEEDQEEGNINIQESEIMTIVSINYDPLLTQEQNKEYERDATLPNIDDNDAQIIEEEEEDTSENQISFSTPVGKGKKHIPTFSTSEPQSNNILETKTSKRHISDFNLQKEISFETSDMNIISGSTLTSPTHELNRCDFIITDITNNQNVTNQTDIAIRNDSNNSSGSSQSISSYLPQFEISELTTNAIINANIVEKTHLKSSDSLSLASNQVEKRSNENKELSQFVTFENPSVQNTLEQSQVIESESFNDRKKKETKRSKKTESDTNTNQNKKSLSLTKNEDFFITNETSQKKKPQKQKDVKFSSRMKELKEQFSTNRNEISIQTTDDNLNQTSSTDINDNDAIKSKVINLSQSGPFYIETEDKKDRKQVIKKKSKQSTSIRIDDTNQENNSNQPLSLSDSLTCDIGSDNQTPPQFENSLITTISNITMKPDNNKETKDILHLSFQQNPSLSIKEKEISHAQLSNSKAESYQSIPQENNQLNVTSETNQTQTELTNSSLSLNNGVDNFDLPNDIDSNQSHHIETPKFENSKLAIISLNQSKYPAKFDLTLSPTTIIKTENDMNQDEKITILQTSNAIEQDFLDGDKHFSNSEIEVIANFNSIENPLNSNSAISTNLELTSNEVVFANTNSINNKEENENNNENIHPFFETDELTTIVSIPFKEQNSTIEEPNPLDFNHTKDRNYSISENNHKVESNPVQFELSQVSRMADISEFTTNGDSASFHIEQNINEFTISTSSKEFHESSPVMIFSSNKSDKHSEINHNVIKNEFLFDQEPVRVDDSNSNKIDLEKSDMINIISVQKKQEKNVNLASSHFDTIDIKQDETYNDKQKQTIEKNIEVTDSYQKADTTEKVLYNESEPLTLVSIQNKKTNKRLSKYHYSSNEIIFANQEQQKPNVSNDQVEKKGSNFEVANLMSFEKSNPIRMTQVFGGLYVKPESNSPIKSKSVSKAKLSVNNDAKFYFEESCNDEIKTIKTSRSLENLDSFTIKKDQRPLTMIFGSFSVDNRSDDEKIEKQTNSNQQEDFKSVQSRSLSNVESQTDDSMMKKKVPNLHTVFGCFEIQSPVISNTRETKIESQKSSISTSTDSFEHQQPEINQTNSLTLTKTFGRFDISPGTYNAEKDSNEDENAKSSFEIIKGDSIKTLSKENDYFYVNNHINDEHQIEKQRANDSEEQKSSFSGNLYSSSIVDLNSSNDVNLERLSLNSINIEPTTNLLNNDIKPFSLSIGQGLNSINVPEEPEQVNKTIPPIVSRNTAISQLRDVYSTEVADINQRSDINLEQLLVNTINIEPNADSKPSTHHSCELYSSENADIIIDKDTNLEQLLVNTINIEPTSSSVNSQNNNIKPLPLSIGQGLNSINVPEEPEQANETIITKDTTTSQLREVYSSEVADINQKNDINFEQLLVNTISIEPNNDIIIDKDSNLEILSLNSINIEPTKATLTNGIDSNQKSLSIEQASNSINVPEELSKLDSSTINTNEITNSKVDLHECHNLFFEVPTSNQNRKNLNLLLNQSQLQIKPSEQIQPIIVNKQSQSIQREIVENKSFEIPLLEDPSHETKSYEQFNNDNNNNVEIKASFPLFFEFLNNQQQQQDGFQFNDDDDKTFSITNSSSLFIPPDRNLNQPILEEEEEDTNDINNNNALLISSQLNSPAFNNIDLCKKLISRQIAEIKSLEREVVKKDVALNSVNRKFELFKESTRQMLAKHFGEIRSLNETNAKLVSQIDSLQTRISSKSDAVFSHLKQRTATCTIVHSSEIISIEPTPTTEAETITDTVTITETKAKSNSINVLVTVTVEDIEPSELFDKNSNSLMYSNRNIFTRRLFISNPSSYEDTSLFANSPLLRESGKITQFSLLPRSSFIPLKVETNLYFEQKEVKPSLTFSFYHLRVTRPKLFSTLHLEDNLTVAHILPQKAGEIRRNIERSQFFVSGENDNKEKNLNELSFYAPKPLNIKSCKKLNLSPHVESHDFSFDFPKLVIKKTQAISFIVQKKQK